MFLNGFIGQEAVKQSLEVFIGAAKARGELPGHILLSGPTGVGKNTLALQLATHLEKPTKVTPATEIIRPADAAAILTTLEPQSTLVILDLHRASSGSQDLLAASLPDFLLDVIIGEGPGARTHRYTMNPFVVIATTSNSQRVSDALKAAFNIRLRLDLYDEGALRTILLQHSEKLANALKLTEDGAAEIAKRSAGLPSNALHLLARLQDYALVLGKTEIDADLVKAAPYRPDWESVGSSGREPIPEEVKRAVWRRDGGTCTKCGSQKKLEYDHIIPVIEGGSDTERNIQILCETCNRSKGRAI